MIKKEILSAQEAQKRAFEKRNNLQGSSEEERKNKVKEIWLAYIQPSIEKAIEEGIPQCQVNISNISRSLHNDIEDFAASYGYWTSISSTGYLWITFFENP